MQQTFNNGADTHVTNNTSKKILVIDDNASITKLLARYFERQGLECHISNDGVSGLSKILGQQYHTIILDLAMPDFSGIDVIQALEKANKLKDKKIFVLTATNIKTSEIIQLMERGIAGLVKKPISPQNLMQIVRN